MKYQPLNNIVYIFNHLKLCLATATHNFKWVKMTDEYYLYNSNQTYADLAFLMLTSSPQT